MKKMAEGLTGHLKIKHKKYTLKLKKEVVTLAKQNFVNGAATKIRLTASQFKSGRNNKHDLLISRIP